MSTMSDAQDVSLTGQEPESDLQNVDQNPTDTNTPIPKDTNGDSSVLLEKEKPQQPEDESLSMPTSEMDAELERMKQQLKQMEQATLGQIAETVEQPIQNTGGGETNVTTESGDGVTIQEGDVVQDDESNASAGTNAANITIPQDDMTPEQALADADARSIYVGNVDYKATSEELNAYFSDCGGINRITIMCNKVTGQPKGFAYVEFQDHNAVENAVILNESMFKGRQLKIVPKRTNIPGIGRGGFRGRARYNRGGRGSYGRRPRRSARGRWVPY